jgi:hypothetical protein
MGYIHYMLFSDKFPFSGQPLHVEHCQKQNDITGESTLKIVDFCLNNGDPLKLILFVTIPKTTIIT